MIVLVIVEIFVLVIFCSSSLPFMVPQFINFFQGSFNEIVERRLKRTMMETEVGLQENFELLSTAILLDSSKSVYTRPSCVAKSNLMHVSCLFDKVKSALLLRRRRFQSLGEYIMKILLLLWQSKSWALIFVRSKSTLSTACVPGYSSLSLVLHVSLMGHTHSVECYSLIVSPFVRLCPSCLLPLPALVVSLSCVPS